MHKPNLANAPTQYHRCCTPKLVTRTSRWEGSLTVILIAAALIAADVFVLLVAGCQSPAQRALDQKTTQTVAQIQAKNKVDVAHAKANGKLADVAPASHPIAATNQTIKHLRAPLETVSVIAGVLFAVFVGLLFTPLSWISKFGLPLSGATAAVTLVDAIALPYVPWLLAAAGVGIVGLLVYECIRHKSIKAGLQAAITDVEAEVYGLSGSTPPPPAASPASTGAATATSPSSFLTSLEAAARNDLATAVTKIKSLLGVKTTAPAVAIAGTKAAPIVTTSPPPPPPAPVPVPV